MQVVHATQASPGQVNEDFVVTGPTWAVVLDGATPHPDVETGCIHSVTWLVRHLGVALARLLTTSATQPLDDALAHAITATCRLHEHTCDLSNPDSPSTTVVMARQRGDELDYLTLADSPFVVDDDGRVRAITDNRTAHLPDYSPAGVRSARNSPAGFYVASTMPDAAHHAIRGTLPAESIRRAALLTDGAARLVERFHQLCWSDLLDLLSRRGPDELIRCTREAERAEAPAQRATRRGKRHDDATAVLISHLSD
jgi:hypothetical protein